MNDTATKPLGLFEGFGIELEYMIVNRASLDLRPICDELLKCEAGTITSDVEFDDISWSNELVLHVVELKTSGPAPTLNGLSTQFEQHLATVQKHAASLDARLMPTASHPWMDPYKEMKLWPHDSNPIYEAFNRIFDCRGHGWANLQSMHINLPFANDEEFGRLHAAIRLLLPILPGLAASSPIMDGAVTGRLDSRLDAYRHHCDNVPIVTGHVIPEAVFTPADYQKQILEAIYMEIDPLDPDGVLHYEFTNARGAIARFERNAIEIRVIDVQECPKADLAIAAAATGVLRLLIDETWSDLASQKAWEPQPLADQFVRTVDDADQTMIHHADYAAMFGYTGELPCTVGQLWQHLLEEVVRRRPADETSFAQDAWQMLATHGPLARRIVQATGNKPTRDDLRGVYGQLCDCLAAGEMFVP